VGGVERQKDVSASIDEVKQKLGCETWPKAYRGQIPFLYSLHNVPYLSTWLVTGGHGHKLSRPARTAQSSRFSVIRLLF
jgi:hypothetical protein